MNENDFKNCGITALSAGAYLVQLRLAFFSSFGAATVIAVARSFTITVVIKFFNVVFFLETDDKLTSNLI